MSQGWCSEYRIQNFLALILPCCQQGGFVCLHSISVLGVFFYNPCWLMQIFLTIQKTPNLKFHESQYLLLPALLPTHTCLHTTFPFKRSLENIQGKCYIKLDLNWGFLADIIRNHKQEVSSRNTYSFGGKKWAGKQKHFPC